MKKYISYYSTGKVQWEGFKNDKGKPEGEWTWYFPSGEVRSKGQYINDKADGIWTWYHSSGEVDCKGWYDNGNYIPEGEWKMKTNLELILQ